jgi:hypothetical protein
LWDKWKTTDRLDLDSAVSLIAVYLWILLTIRHQGLWPDSRLREGRSAHRSPQTDPTNTPLGIMYSPPQHLQVHHQLTLEDGCAIRSASLSTWPFVA